LILLALVISSSECYRASGTLSNQLQSGGLSARRGDWRTKKPEATRRQASTTPQFKGCSASRTCNKRTPLIFDQTPSMPWGGLS
jgi:hypothetical protein